MSQQLEEALTSAKEEYQDMFARIEFERAEYEQEIDSAQYEITTRDENIKVIICYFLRLCRLPQPCCMLISAYSYLMQVL